jgi:hypothetical protein
MKFLRYKTGLAVLLITTCNCAQAETVSIVVGTNLSPRVEYGAMHLVEAITADRSSAALVRSRETPGSKIYLDYPRDAALGQEGFRLRSLNNNDVVISSGDDSGMLYGCLELADRIRKADKLPTSKDLQDKPAMRLRGTCVGMQKTFILPGRKVYEYPYTPELFPWFYDKNLWLEYLDFLAANRMNTLYLWSGHPFASLVRVKEYPYAVEVPDDTFEKNQEQFRWLARECDKRGIWLVQMFYNILVSKPFAEKNGISTQLSAPTPLVADYTRKSIAEFVREYPNVGLMLCLGEALQGTSNQTAWATQTVLPGVLDGMKAAGLKEQPPVVIRTHAMDAEAVIPACFQVYSNLFTETKYNGESLTTWEPRGKDQATHLEMAKLGPHLVNVHILANLEPFRYGATEFIKKCVQASRDRLGASGIHLYPLSYWNWPYSPDVADPPLLQWNRDWIWFEAWARYAWNPDLPQKEDHAYWVDRLAGFYGDTNAAEKILDACNSAGEVAPMLIRRFGITEGNRQTLSLGMTLDQLVNPQKYGAIDDLWLSQAPPGERLDEYLRKEWNHELHIGETPDSVAADALRFSRNAVVLTELAAPFIKKNQVEFKRLQNDFRCISAMSEFYANKFAAAADLMTANTDTNRENATAHLMMAQGFLSTSVSNFETLTRLTDNTYRFANSMQTSHRKIPFPGAVRGKGTNYLWSQVLPLYQKELDNFRTTVAKYKAGEHINLVETNAPKSGRNTSPELAEPE